MNPLRRNRLLAGTKHCIYRKVLRMSLLASICFFATIGTVAALDELIDPLVLAKVQMHRFGNAERALRAEAQVKELEAILNGQVEMMEREDGSKYGRVSVCEWTIVELIEEM